MFRICKIILFIASGFRFGLMAAFVYFGQAVQMKRPGALRQLFRQAALAAPGPSGNEDDFGHIKTPPQKRDGVRKWKLGFRASAPLLRRSMQCLPGRFPDLRVHLLAAPSRMKTALFRPGCVTFHFGLCDVPFVRLRASVHVPCQYEKASFSVNQWHSCGFHHRSQLRDSGGIAPPSLLSPAFRRSTWLISYFKL
jgi:hypothetical protein